MINLYSGTPGSGKSLHQAIDAYSWLGSGHVLLANYDINVNLIKSKRFNIQNFVYISNDKLTPDFLINFSVNYFKNHKFGEGKIRLYIDEAQILFNAREWQKTHQSNWISFFSQHRKFGFDIFLIAQFDRLIDRQIRSLIEYEFIHRKVSNYGLKGKLMSLISGGNLFVAVKVWYPLKERVGAQFFHGRKRFYNLYNTLDTFSLKKDNNCGVSSSSDPDRLLHSESDVHVNSLSGIKNFKSDFNLVPDRSDQSAKPIHEVAVLLEHGTGCTASVNPHVTGKIKFLSQRKF